MYLCLWEYFLQVCEFGGNDCIKAPSIVDRTTTKYVNRLVQRVDAVYRHLRQRCDLPSLPPLPKPQKSAEGQPQKTPEEPPEGRPQKSQEGQVNVQPKIENQMPTTTKTDMKKGIKPADTVRATRVTTTTTTTTKATTKEQKSNPNTTTKPMANPKQSQPSANVRKKRKLIVFEINDFGVPVARVEYQ